MAKYIGVDMGGTSLKAGLVEDRQIIKEKSVPTPKDKDQVLDSLAMLIQSLYVEDLRGVGIITAGTVDRDQGKVLTIGGNIKDWKGTDIGGFLKDKFPDLATYVENDANGAGLCEMRLGAGKAYKSGIVLTLGTGLGGCLYYENKLIRGARSRAGELGHVILYPGARPCICGQKGCAERYISATGLKNNYMDLTGQDLEAEDIFIQDSEEKIQAVEKFTDDMAYFLVSIKNFYDPEIIVIGGGLVYSKDKFWDQMLESYKEKLNSYDSMAIQPAQFGNKAGIIGASLVVEDEEA